MFRGQLQDLLELLHTDEYRTAAYFAEQLGVSVKTARIRIKELNERLPDDLAWVESKSRFGYKLIILDKQRFEELIEAKNEIKIPETGQERSEYLLAYLLWREDYIKIEALCDFLYVSKTTLTYSLKRVESVLKRYRLGIERRPNYGIKVCGEEFDMRRLISDYYIKRNALVGLSIIHQEQEMSILASHIRGLMKKYQVFLSEIAFENFVDYVYVAWKRIRSGHYLIMGKESLPEMGVKEHAFIGELIKMIEQHEGIHYTRDEETYLLLYLAGKRMIGNILENDSNFVIHEQMDRLTMEILNLVSKEFQIDFHHNFDVRMSLNQHLVPFDIRIRYDIPLINPLLQEIKEKYSLAYQMSYEGSRVLINHYQKGISEDEIGYFALIFQLALEKDHTDVLSDILVVCSTGKGSSRLLKYKYEQEFSEYVKNIYVCDLIELETFDFTKIDYIFTTVPITRIVPVPIVEVGTFLGIDDIQKVTGILRRGSGDYLEQYYGRQRFLTDIQGDTKEEVLQAICEIISIQEQVVDNFFDLVIEREVFAQMDYGNYISIPHPNQIASIETFAYVTVLAQPIIWNQLPVQVVLLTSVGSKKDHNRQKFYEATARFALNRTSIAKLIEKPDYDLLFNLLQG